MSVSEQLLNSNRLCLDELVAYVRMNKGKAEFVFRFDYASLVVMAIDWMLYTRTYKAQNHLDKGKIGKPIIFIPESPHKAEFFDEPMKCFNRPDVHCRPLNGTEEGAAGHLFRTHSPEMFAKIIENEVINDSGTGPWHPIIVANACRFQCSLGKPIVDDVRDINFLTSMFGEDPELNDKNLIKRIKDYSPYHLVVCACTVGGQMAVGAKGRKRKNLSAIKNWLIDNAPDVYEQLGEISLRGVVEYFLQNAGIPFIRSTHPCLWFSSRFRIVRTVKKKSRKRLLSKKRVAGNNQRQSSQQ